MKLKKAREIIPEFDGNLQAKLKEFLSACSYAIKTMNPIDEQTLTRCYIVHQIKRQSNDRFQEGYICF